MKIISKLNFFLAFFLTANCQAEAVNENTQSHLMMKTWIECNIQYADMYYDVAVSPTEIAIGAVSSCWSLEDKYRKLAADEMAKEGMGGSSSEELLMRSIDELKENVKSSVIDRVIRHRSKKKKS